MKKFALYMLLFASADMWGVLPQELEILTKNLNKLIEDLSGPEVPPPPPSYDEEDRLAAFAANKAFTEHEVEQARADLKYLEEHKVGKPEKLAEWKRLIDERAEQVVPPPSTKRPLPPTLDEIKKFKDEFNTKTNFTQAGLEQGREYLKKLKESDSGKAAIADFEAMVNAIDEALKKPKPTPGGAPAAPPAPAAAKATEPAPAGSLAASITAVKLKKTEPAAAVRPQPTEDELDDLYLAYRDMPIAERQKAVEESKITIEGTEKPFNIKEWLKTYVSNGGEAERLTGWNTALNNPFAPDYNYPKKKK